MDTRFQANENDETAVHFIKEAAKKIILNYWKNRPLYLGEDFGLFTQHFKGAMFGLGSGINTPALHNQTMIFLTILLQQEYLFFHHISNILQMHTNSTIELNTTAYQKNLSFLRTTLGKSTNFMLKGNAYGHGGGNF
jgi:metal-dependent amidase/aminoacylase/carboxypeptidase family protein